MANITLQGNEIHTSGNLPELGTVAQNFTLVAEDLSEKTLSEPCVTPTPSIIRFFILQIFLD